MGLAAAGVGLAAAGVGLAAAGVGLSAAVELNLHFEPARQRVVASLGPATWLGWHRCGVPSPPRKAQRVLLSPAARPVGRWMLLAVASPIRGDPSLSTGPCPTK